MKTITEIESDKFIGMDYYMNPQIYLDTERQRQREQRLESKRNFHMELTHLRLLFYRGAFEF